jgi:hypothetical protein
MLTNLALSIHVLRRGQFVHDFLLHEDERGENVVTDSDADGLKGYRDFIVRSHWVIGLDVVEETELPVDVLNDPGCLGDHLKVLIGVVVGKLFKAENLHVL